MVEKTLDMEASERGENEIHFLEKRGNEIVNKQRDFINPQINVLLLHAHENITECIPVTNIRFGTTGIDLLDVIQNLKGLGLLPGFSEFYYYSCSTGMYVYCGREPLTIKIIVPYRDLSEQGSCPVLLLKIRYSPDQLQSSTTYGSEMESINESISSETTIDDGKKRRTRHKERKISEVLDLVLKWRKLYAGVRDPISGNLVKLSLEDSAKQIGVAKKSLDDYLLQIRQAKINGFDFQLNCEERIGILRNFVKKTRNRGSSKLAKREIEEDEVYVPKCLASKKISKMKYKKPE